MIKVSGVVEFGSMFMAERNFGATEFAVSRAILELRDQYEYISAATIADYISCDRTTVLRSLRRMIKAGLVVRGDGSPIKGGYRYDYIGKR